MVQAPGFFTFAAQMVRRDWSRSVAVMVSRPAELVDGGLEEEVRQDGNGGLALDHGLRGRQLAQQLGAGDGDLEIAGRDGFGGDGGGGHVVGSPLLLRLHLGNVLRGFCEGGGHGRTSPLSDLPWSNTLILGRVRGFVRETRL